MKKVAVIGGSGFVGSAVCTMLAERSQAVRVVSRQDRLTQEFEWRRYDPFIPSSLESAVAGVDVVINLAGILNNRLFHSRDFFDVHVLLTRKVLAACHYNHVTRYLHMSALNAAVDAVSEYLQTKGVAEDIAHDDDRTQTTSFQPSVIFGRGGGLLSRFAKLLKYAPPLLPLACADTVFAPVYIQDVAKAIVNSMETDTVGQRIQLCGPELYALSEIIDYVAAALHRNIRVIRLPDPLAKLQAHICEFIPGKPFSLDNYRSLQIDSVCTEVIPCPTRLSEVGHFCLY